MHNLSTMVHTLLQGTEEVYRRLPTVREKYQSSLSVEPGEDDLLDLTKITRQDQLGTQSGPSTAVILESGLGRIVESELLKSRVYSRNTQRHSISSVTSSYSSTSDWSILSGMSLAQISNISVLSLPICAYEIYGSRHYMQSKISSAPYTETKQVHSKTAISNTSKKTPLRQARTYKGFRSMLSLHGSIPLPRDKERLSVPNAKVLLLGECTAINHSAMNVAVYCLVITYFLRSQQFRQNHNTKSTTSNLKG